MTQINVDSSLKGALGELYFKHFCKINNYCYIKLEDIYRNFTPQGYLIFKCGFERLKIKIPEKEEDEIRMVCKPSNHDEESPSFVFDFLTYSREYKKLYWVEIKTGNSELRKNQEKMIKLCKLPVKIFKVTSKPPEQIDIVYKNYY